jgi:predicted ABC-type ATPase
MDQPFMLMIAGPNGSGKTTLTRWLRERDVDFGEYINPDDIAEELSGSYDQRTTQAQARLQINAETPVSRLEEASVLKRSCRIRAKSIFWLALERQDFSSSFSL